MNSKYCVTTGLSRPFACLQTAMDSSVACWPSTIGAGSGENTLIRENTMMDTPMSTGMTIATLLRMYFSIARGPLVAQRTRSRRSRSVTFGCALSSLRTSS
jgi:hypothetical protein